MVTRNKMSYEQIMNKFKMKIRSNGFVLDDATMDVVDTFPFAHMDNTLFCDLTFEAFVDCDNDIPVAVTP